MSRVTVQQQAKRFTQTISAGAKVFGNSNTPAYTLMHLTSTSKHNAGTYDTIIIPYIELGRSSSCAVSFGEDMKTVHRRHAAIVKQDNNIVMIKHLGGDNPTLVNGRPVKQEWYLNNGDIIQLSMEGPRLRYNISESGTAKLGFTKKAQLVAQQAIKPYQKALSIMGLVFLLISSGLGYLAWKNAQKANEAYERAEIAMEELEKAKEQGLAEIDSLEARGEREKQVLQQQTDDMRKNQVDMAKKNKVLEAKLKKIEKAPPPTSQIPGRIPDNIKQQVYFLRVLSIEYNAGNGKQMLDGGWTGTCFLLNDGSMVTARHCIEGWRFIESLENPLAVLNYAENNGGYVKVAFEAISPNYRTFTFVYDTNQPNNIAKNNSSDKEYDTGTGTFKIAGEDLPSDWAVIRLGERVSPMTTDKAMARDPKSQTKVHVLGYSYGASLQDRKPNPLYSESVIAQDGLVNGVINLTDRNFGQGNSGGPVFVYNTSTNQYQVIGIVSAGKGSEIGIVVPISQIP